MKIKYGLAQFLGCLQIVVLFFIVILWDKMIVLELPFEPFPYKWNTLMKVMFLLIVVFFLLFYFIRNFVTRNKERRVNRPHPTIKEKAVILISSSCSGNWVDILFVLSFIFYFAWIPDACMDYAKEDYSLYRILVYFIGFITVILTKPTIYKESKEIDNDSRTLLISGISLIKNKPYHTIEPLTYPFEDYKNLKTMIILMPNKIELVWSLLKIEATGDSLDKAYASFKARMLRVYLQYEDFSINKMNKDKTLKSLLLEKGLIVPDCLDAADDTKIEAILLSHSCKGKLEFVLDERKKKYLAEIEEIYTDLINKSVKYFLKKKGIADLPNLEIDFTDPADYNDFDDCNEKCYDKLVIMMRKYRLSDENIIVNITSGTAVVTSALTLNAIKGRREMVYVRQGAKGLAKANPNVMMIQFDELFTEKVENA